MDKTKNDEYFTLPRYELAGISERLIALFIDTMIIGAVIGMLGVSGSEWALSNVVVHLIYHWFFLTQLNGQTPGKMLMGIRVVKTNGQPLSAADAILRYFGYLLNSLVLHIGWIWAMFDSKSQGWHDKIAGTYVVKARGESRPKQVYVSTEKHKNDDDIAYI